MERWLRSVTELELSDERFAVMNQLALNKELENSMGGLKGSGRQQVVIEFDP